MKRFFSSVVVALVAAACSQQTVAPAARLSGTHVLAVADPFVFVTSTDRNELRAIDTRSSNFVRAPNPLEPLSIPVVDTPDNIARDVRFNGRAVVVGQYVYAWSQGGRGISAVGTAETSLKEEQKIRVNDPLTAVAARGQSAEGQSSTLYYATYESGAGQQRFGQLYEQAVPAAGKGAPPPARRINSGSPGPAINAIAVLPGANQLVVATQAEVFWIDVASGAMKTVTGFSGKIRELAVDGPKDVTDTFTRVRVFGLLDETSCGDDSCSGVEAVDFLYTTKDASNEPATIGRAWDENGVPMKKVFSTGGFFTSLDISVDGVVRNTGTGQNTGFELLGLASEGNGSIIAFDAEGLRMVDTDPSLPAATNRSRSADGGELQGNLIPISLADGAARTETIDFIFGGELRPGEPEEPFDLRVFDNCTETFNPDAGATGCANADGGTQPNARFAGMNGPRPFVVRGSASGYMGRAAPNAVFSFPPEGATQEELLARYFHHAIASVTDDVTLADGGTATVVNPERQLVVELVVPNVSALVQNDTYLLDTRSNFRPLNLAVNTSSYPVHFVPESVVRSVRNNRTYIAYPALNSILEMKTDEYATDQGSYKIDRRYQ